MQAGDDPCKHTASLSFEFEDFAAAKDCSPRHGAEDCEEFRERVDGDEQSETSVNYIPATKQANPLDQTLSSCSNLLERSVNIKELSVASSPVRQPSATKSGSQLTPASHQNNPRSQQFFCSPNASGVATPHQRAHNSIPEEKEAPLHQSNVDN